MKMVSREHTVHLCVDMQRMFAEQTQWQTSWAAKVLPQVVALTARAPDHTVFTRFIPAKRSGQGAGMWKKYYEQWASMTLEKLDAGLVELMPELAKFVPPAKVVDKHIYGPWIETDLHQRLQESDIDTLIVSGGEIDVCVLATVLGAVDFGYRVIVASDASCSSDDESYDAIVTVLKKRFSIQIEVEETAKILAHWQ